MLSNLSSSDRWPINGNHLMHVPWFVLDDLPKGEIPSVVSQQAYINCRLITFRCIPMDTSPNDPGT